MYKALLKSSRCCHPLDTIQYSIQRAHFPLPLFSHSLSLCPKEVLEYALRSPGLPKAYTYCIYCMRLPILLVVVSLRGVDSAKAVRNKAASMPSALTIRIEDINSDGWRLNQAADILSKGGIGIIPTDTCYSFVAGIDSKEGIQRILRLKNEGQKKPLSVLCKDLAAITKYTSNLSDQKWVFKMLKSTLPGPFTYILPSSKEVPSILVDNHSNRRHMRRWKRREIGVRIPEDGVCSYLTDALNVPLISGSVPHYGEDENIITSYQSEEEEDAEEGEEEAWEDSSFFRRLEGEGVEGKEGYGGKDEWMARWRKQVDFIVDCGPRGASSGSSGRDESSMEGRSTVVDLTSGAPVILRQGRGLLNIKDFLP